MFSHSRIYLILSALFAAIIFSCPANALGPTIAQNGVWDSVSSVNVAQAKINDRIERVCLPKIIFKDEIDHENLKKQLKQGINSQDAIFHLYHDGLGKPKKHGGMYFATDVYLKDMKMTYTGFLRKLGYKFSIGKGPAYEDASYIRDVLSSRPVIDTTPSKEEAEREKEKQEIKKRYLEEKNKRLKSSGMRVTTIFDVLPKGVIPPSIRRQQEEIAKRVNFLKNRPYETETVQLDPLRWAAGRMGLIREDGSIIGANVEGQKLELWINPPEEKNWLTSEMISELNGKSCEFVLQRYANGLEVFENNRYLLRDVYFHDLKLSWGEWLQKHGKTNRELPARADFASGTVVLEVKLVSGKWNSNKAVVLCQIDFDPDEKLVEKSELFRIPPPDPRPKNYRAFAEIFDKAFSGKEADVSLLVCRDGKPYHELGQKRAHRIYFPGFKATLAGAQKKVLSGEIR